MTIKLLHVSLEYTYGVGGIKTVLTGLLPALQANGLTVSIVTPYYDFLNSYNLTIRFVSKISHMYKNRIQNSILFKVALNNLNSTNSNVEHYLIAPMPNSEIANIFGIHSQENIYKAFKHSEPQHRLEYFNSAVGSLIKIHSPEIPVFDIIQTHAWHTSLVICLIKQFKKLSWIKSNSTIQLNPDPKIINTIHMLSNDQGLISDPEEIAATLTSVGLPLKIKFLFNNKMLNQMYLGLQYADQNILVSNGLWNNILIGNHYGLGEIFKKLHKLGKINAITNGINTSEFNPSLSRNLKEYYINHNGNILTSKLAIKIFLIKEYHLLIDNPDKLWFLYVGRFALEKGIDMLEHALSIIKKHQGHLIIMGRYIGGKYKSPEIKVLLDPLYLDKNITIIDNEEEQTLFGKHWRAASDFTLIPSHYEACGLVAMESLINYSFPISSDVQGLPDTVIDFTVDPEMFGNGFTYKHDANQISNLQHTINSAIAIYTNWKQQNILNKILTRIHQEAILFDWLGTPVNKYLNLYKKTLETTPTKVPYVIAKTNIKILHLSLEYKQATVGGVGTVTSELLAAQNKLNHACKMEASIITPYYDFFPPANLITKVKHAFDNQSVESSIYCIANTYGKHYLIKSKNDLFNLSRPEQIYQKINLLERIKYFNSAVASFIATYPKLDLDFIQIHDWPGALTAVILKEIYKLTQPKIIYTAHINNNDRGSCSIDDLAGINLALTKSHYSLKQLGIEYSNYVIGVSENVLNECCSLETIKPYNHEIASLVLSFLYKKYTNNSIGILNGINYNKNCYLKQFNHISPNLATVKQQLKQQLAISLKQKMEIWSIDPHLPLVLYIGRFSKEKGIDCFKDIIYNFQQQMVFVAFGKGINKDIVDLVVCASKNQPNIFISFSEQEQQKYGELIRAAADFVFVPSHNEACGLAAMEGLANGSLCITSGVGGLKEFINPFSYQADKIYGNGFLYQDYNKKSLFTTISNALNLWNSYSLLDKHYIHENIMQQAQQLDWLTKRGSIKKYLKTYQHIMYFKSDNNMALLKSKI